MVPQGGGVRAAQMHIINVPNRGPQEKPTLGEGVSSRAGLVGAPVARVVKRRRGEQSLVGLEERQVMQRERKVMESWTWGHKAVEQSQMGPKRGLMRYEKVRASRT